MSEWKFDHSLTLVATREVWPARNSSVQLSKFLRVFTDVKILRILVAGLIGIAAMLATLFAAVIVVFTGICAYLVHFFRRQSAPGRGLAQSRSRGMSREGAIDVVATSVPNEPPKL